MRVLACGRSMLCAAALGLGGAGCAPALDWREFVPEGSGVHVAFPCRPDRLSRPVAVAGAQVRMEMLVCSAGDATYALGFFDVDGPARVASALDELHRIAVANVQGVDPRWTAWQVKGMTPNDSAGRLTVAGRRPDGAVAKTQAAFFAHGLRVYQATVIGAEPVSTSVDTFFGALSFPI